MRASSLLFLTLGIFSRLVQAENNVTIVLVDDASPDQLTGQRIQYIPEDAWKAAANNECEDCVVHGSVPFAYKGTWHEGVTNTTPTFVVPKAIFSFIGTSVTVGCLIETNATQADVSASRSWDLLISVDNKTAGSFLLNQSIGATASLDNVMVYTSSILPMGNHTVEIFGAVPVNDSDTSKPLLKQSVVILDYIQYTIDTDKLPANFNASSLPTPPGANTTQTSTSAPAQTSTSNALPCSRGIGLSTIAGAALFVAALLG
ncbi:hypothetical protein GY45DRAFT_593292 [Cubamyces sp. BRFM 1775]|nr:hypothetical protein GY45DRAFT_593292 [Cubamyces sp. BRFM 1775]